MRYNKVNLNLNKSFPFEVYKIEKEINHNDELHQHKELELDIVIAGKGQCLIGEKTYSMDKGDIILINNMEYHMSVFDEDLKMIVFHFDPMFIFEGNDFDYNYLRPYFNRDAEISHKIDAKHPMASTIMDCVLEIEREWDKKKEGYRLIIKALLMKLLATLYRYFKEQHITLDSDNKDLNRLRPVVTFLNENYDSKIRLEDAAAIVYMNRTYFSTYFKNVMGISFSAYLERLRIDKAIGLIQSTDFSINQIALMTGFADANHFVKVFKKQKGTTPKVYKQNNIV